MQTLGPYRLDRMLGSCPVGRVWVGVDATGNAVSIAVLDPAVARDPRWRTAFSAAANTVARSADVAVVGADFAAAAPWAAWASSGAEDVFVALGQPYQPIVDLPRQGGHPHAQTRPDQGQAVSMAQVRPHQAQPPTAAETPWDHSYSPATHASSATPASGAPSAPPVPSNPGYPSLTSDAPGSPPYSGAPVPTSGGPDRSERVLAAPATTAPRRPATWIGVVLLVLLLPGAGSGIIAATMRPAGGAQPVPTATATSSRSAPAFVTPKPTRPGTEPPRDGAWPNWPTFAATDKTVSVRLAGIGFTFQLPATWQCTATGRATGFARYSCDDAAGAAGVSGDLLARTCPKPCDSARRAQLRMAEEAWGLRWIRAGTVTVWAEANQVDGAPRYGLVFVTFWHSTPEGALDGEFVFRMTAPPDRADEVRKVANSIHQVLS
jgi:hypothetical protein